MDRRDKTVVDSVKVGRGGKFERILDDDRVYLWTAGPKKWEMYWMQDLEKEGEDDLLVQVNQYLMNPDEAAPGGAAAAAPDVTNNNAQVDALSNILENLGVPEGAEVPVPCKINSRDLDLGRFAGRDGRLETAPAAPAPLSEVLTPAAITSLLQDEAAKNTFARALARRTAIYGISGR
jgi:hypothetical protein